MSYLAHRRKYFQIPGCVASYKLDGTSGAVIDSVAGNNGTNVGATRGVTGKIGTAFSFDGVNDYVDLNSYDFTKSFSLCFWLKFDPDNQGYPSGFNDILGQPSIDNDNRRVYVEIVDSTRNIRCIWRNGGTFAGCNLATSYTSVGWNHFVLTMESSSGDIKGYMNGTLTQLSASSILPPSSGSLYLGSRDFTISSFYTGLTDEVEIFDTVITAAQVTELYNSGDGKTYPY